jgi:hypothetical protein
MAVGKRDSITLNLSYLKKGDTPMILGIIVISTGYKNGKWYNTKNKGYRGAEALSGFWALYYRNRLHPTQ